MYTQLLDVVKFTDLLMAFLRTKMTVPVIQSYILITFEMYPKCFHDSIH